MLVCKPYQGSSPSLTPQLKALLLQARTESQSNNSWKSCVWLPPGRTRQSDATSTLQQQEPPLPVLSDSHHGHLSQQLCCCPSISFCPSCKKNRYFIVSLHSWERICTICFSFQMVQVTNCSCWNWRRETLLLLAARAGNELGGLYSNSTNCIKSQAKHQSFTLEKCFSCLSKAATGAMKILFSL